MICAACNTIFTETDGVDYKKRRKHGSHPATWESLVLAVNEGCLICISAYRVFLPYKPRIVPPGKGKPLFTYLLDFRRTQYNPKPYLRIFCRCVSGIEVVRAEVKLFPYDMFLSMRQPPREFSSEVESSMDPPESRNDAMLFELAKDWLTDCLHEHEECHSHLIDQNGVTESWRPPKRLLELKDDSVRLITPSPTQFRMFATLSHCWGTDSNFLQLTTSNLDEFRQDRGIPLSRLPLTFREAVDITFRLGLEYLWIDSLCILQSGPGSHEDWLSHTSDMASIYSNCTVNIHAHNSASPFGGCYSARHSTQHRLVVGPTTVECTWGPDPIVNSRNMSGKTWVLLNKDISGPKAIKSASKLSSRGWVLQEWLLSPRVLHIGTDQMFWECRELPFASESTPDGLPACIEENWMPKAFIFGPLLGRYLEFSVEAGIKEDNWYMILKDYTRRNLTFPEKDKLAAIGGIAQIISTLRGGDIYTAGLFRSRFLSALLWAVHSGHYQDPLVRPAMVWRAPSWSWASMDGALSFSNCVESSTMEFLQLDPPDEVATIEDISVDLTDPSYPWGGVTSGYLRLRGHLLPFNLPTRERRCVDTAHCIEAKEWIKYYFDDPQWEDDLTDTYQIMPLISRWYPVEDDSDMVSRCWGLILQPISSSSSKTRSYRRVGICRYYDLEYYWKNRSTEMAIDIL
ncbi:heterokaryon incompatibility protein-domain-containing protein [Xylaria flabelliformis]|nr:heterokaryon incompatibility protein-domain-containing protein [Xylaria flabelliformis]